MQTKDAVIGITLNAMYKLIYFSLADTLLVLQIALRLLLIIPSFMFLGWHDAARMADCHFKITITVRTGL